MVSLFVEYFVWHYTRAVRDLLNIVGNFLWFFWEFFSIRLLFATLFTPFHRLEERPKSKLDLGEIAQAFMVTTMMRIVGAAMRLFVILIGLVCIVITIIAGIGMLLVWLAAPFMVVTLIGLSVVFLSI